jgi:hypothetical protein
VVINSGTLELLAYMGKTRNPYKVLVQRLKNGRGHFGHLHVYHVFFKSVTELQCEGVNWIELVQNRMKWHDFCEMSMNLQITQYRLF